MPASSDRPADDANLPRSGPAGGEVTLSVALPSGVPLHARPAADLVRAASRLPVPVTIEANGKRANARSILEVLALGAVGGTELTLSADGPGAAEAVEALAQLVASLGA